MSNKGMREANANRSVIVAAFATERKRIKEEIRIARIQKNMNRAFKLQQELDKLPRNSNPTRLRNLCMITNRCRGVVLYKHFGMCGFKIREFANMGLIPGVRKR